MHAYALRVCVCVCVRMPIGYDMDNPTMAIVHWKNQEFCIFSVHKDGRSSCPVLVIKTWNRMSGEILVFSLPWKSEKKIALILAKELCSNKMDEISSDSEGKLEKKCFLSSVSFNLRFYQRCHLHLKLVF